MREWTDAAREELEQYLKRTQSQVAATGADPDEVAGDIRRHVDKELAATNSGIVTQEDIRRVLGRIGNPEEMPAAGMVDQAGEKETAPIRPGRFAMAMFTVLGVLLPAFALILELLSGMCASIFFDPIPTIWHVLLVALVPLANATVCAALAGVWRPPSAVLVWLNGLAAGVAFYYALVFLPLSPFAVLGILYLGLGLVPLAPLISFLAALSLRRRLRKAFFPTGVLRPGLWHCLLGVLAVLLALELPKAITLTGIRMAAGEDPAAQARGVRVLRHWGSEDILLRACYEVRKPVMDMVTFVYDMTGASVPAAKIQNIYYRVTGTPYNAVQPPDIQGLRRGALINSAEFDFAQGSDAVAARVRELTLVQSRLDGVVEASASTAYLEWTMVFKNDSPMQREARAQVVLPPGGVVSRLTLWVDGEEREAAFAGRGQVKKAYKKVVQQQRDPVLVTTTGPDHILVQCFPVPPGGGEMKIRVGITAPLYLDTPDSGLLRLPFFLEQNFGVVTSLNHSVWMEGDGALAPLRETAGLIAEHPEGKNSAVRGNIGEASLTGVVTLRSGRPAAATEARADDERVRDGQAVRQTIRAALAEKPRRVVFVIDGSRRMAPLRSVLEQTLLACPDGTEFAVLTAGDAVAALCDVKVSAPETRKAAADGIGRLAFEGGCDNVPALLKAWELAAASPAGAIVWLHATQPIQMADSEALLQKWQRRSDNPVLYDFQFGAGPNKVAEALNGLPAVRRGPNFGGGATDIRRIFEQWSGSAPGFSYERRREPGGAGTTVGEKGSSHIVRLWANDEIRRLAASRDQGDRKKAIEMAGTYQLVTPVSGAVVLETQKQYDEAGLTPAESSSVPQVVPEPATWALLLVGTLLLLAVHNRRRILEKVHSR